MLTLAFLAASGCGTTADEQPIIPEKTNQLDSGTADTVTDVGKPPVDMGSKPDKCIPKCPGNFCGENGCGGLCSCPNDRYACCNEACVAPPDKCTCTCSCSSSNPNCQSVTATSSSAKATCSDVCANACMGCGAVTSASGDCPPTAKCN